MPANSQLSIFNSQLCKPTLAYLPVETVVKSRQSDYYRVLGEADLAGDCACFILFMLDAIAEALEQAINSQTRVKTPEQILQLLLEQPTLSLADVAARLGKSTSAVERAAGKLQEQGRLRFVGPRKGGRWEAMENG